MQPQTEGLEEQGPSKVPYVNDPHKPANPPSKTEEDDEVDGEGEGEAH
ncbi:hypothetical protein ACSMEV_13750 [Pseudomonas sp. MLB6B]